MNIENVKALAEILSAYGLTSLEVSEGGDAIRIEKAAGGQAPPMQPAVASSPTESDAEAGADSDAGSQSVNFNRLAEVKSPLVGVFYSAPSPGAETFVSIGSKVKRGDVLCIIETMKLLNEIQAEQDGEIVDICVKNGDIVEFGQVLFKMF
jgi:acetyl-CoA carboxylase biotin carboxyl carrier protein